MEAASKPAIKRKTLIVDRKFQYQFAICAFLAQFVVAISFLSVLQLRLRQIILQYHSLEAQKIVDQVASNSLAIMIGVSVVTGGLAFLMAIFFTNKIVGPLPRFTRALSELGQGNIGVRVNLRPGDVLRDFAESFNGALESLSAKVEAGELTTSEAAQGDAADKPDDESADGRDAGTDEAQDSEVPTLQA